MSVDWDALVIGPVQGVFGKPVTYMPALGAPFGIDGTFENAYSKKVEFEDGTVGVTTVAPTLGIRLSEFSSEPIQNDRLFVVAVNTTYAVREVRPDGMGAAILTLNKVSTP